MFKKFVRLGRGCERFPGWRLHSGIVRHGNGWWPRLLSGRPRDRSTTCRLACTTTTTDVVRSCTSRVPTAWTHHPGGPRAFPLRFANWLSPERRAPVALPDRRPALGVPSSPADFQLAGGHPSLVRYPLQLVLQSCLKQLDRRGKQPRPANHPSLL